MEPTVRTAAGHACHAAGHDAPSAGKDSSRSARHVILPGDAKIEAWVLEDGGESKASSEGVATGKHQHQQRHPPRWNRKVSSNLMYLQALHDEHGWIPGWDHIRPTPDMIEKKRRFVEESEGRFESQRDMILQRIFLLETGRVEDGSGAAGDLALAAAAAAAANRAVFTPTQAFPYAMPPGTHHGVLWTLRAPPELTEASINADIAHGLRRHLGPDARWEFVWYENPKMNLPALYHVQVFWHVVVAAEDEERTSLYRVDDDKVTTSRQQQPHEPPSAAASQPPPPPLLPQQLPRKVVFLDVDGVLHPFTAKDHFAAPCMAALRSLVRRRTGAEAIGVVLSSSWQFPDASRALVDEALLAGGMPASIGTTAMGQPPKSSAKGRCKEIRSWLDAHRGAGVGGWVAIDDLDLKALGEDHFVRTDSDIGLTVEDAARAEEMLGFPGSS